MTTFTEEDLGWWTQGTEDDMDWVRTQGMASDFSKDAINFWGFGVYLLTENYDLHTYIRSWTPLLFISLCSNRIVQPMSLSVTTE